MKDNTITSRSISRNLTQDTAVCGLFAALIAVGAFMKIVIPVGADTMNFTLQWLFVLLAGLLLGSKRAFRSVAVYLITGLIGFPIFARGGGPAYLLRPTFGFLLGFALAAWAIGFLCERFRPLKSSGLFCYYDGRLCAVLRNGNLLFLYDHTSAVFSDSGRNWCDLRSILPADHAAGPDALCAGNYDCRTIETGGFGGVEILRSGGGIVRYKEKSRREYFIKTMCFYGCKNALL